MAPHSNWVVMASQYTHYSLGIVCPGWFKGPSFTLTLLTTCDSMLINQFGLNISFHFLFSSRTQISSVLTVAISVACALILCWCLWELCGTVVPECYQRHLHLSPHYWLLLSLHLLVLCTCQIWTAKYHCQLTLKLCKTFERSQMLDIVPWPPLWNKGLLNGEHTDVWGLD